MKQSQFIDDFDVPSSSHRPVDMLTHARINDTYMHALTSQIFLSLTTLSHEKNMVLINYGSHLWGSTFITYDRSS